MALTWFIFLPFVLRVDQWQVVWRSQAEAMAICSLPLSVLKKLLSTYRRTQVSRRGKYSIERLLALQEYTKSASIPRVLLVCILTPMPTLFIALALEAIPLQNPSDGWQANRGMWLRTALALLIASSNVFNQVRELVPGVGVRGVDVLSMSSIVSIVYTTCTAAVAAVWVFPIPFMIIVMNGPLLVSLAAAFFIIVARCSVQRMLQLAAHRQTLVRYAWFLLAQAMLCLVYPVYSAVFFHLTSQGYEVVALLILPAVRICMRNLIAYSSSHLEDLVPAAAIFTVEFFNSLYLAASMQRVSSLFSVLVIIAIDAAQLLLALNELRIDTSELAALVAQSGSSTRSSPPNVLFETVNQAAEAALRSASSEQLLQIRLRSCVKHKLSPEVEQLLEGMDRQRSATVPIPSHQLSVIMIPASQLKRWWSSSKVAPAYGAVTLPNATDNLTVMTGTAGLVRHPSRHSQRRSSDLFGQLDQTLQVAFTIEYTALSEYLESVMPLLYVGYISLLMRLSSRQYHMELVGISELTLERSNNNTFLYGLMEMASFVLLATLLWRGMQLNVLHVVAFVLETQMALVHGMLVTWMLIAQEFQVEHWGASLS